MNAFRNGLAPVPLNVFKKGRGRPVPPVTARPLAPDAMQNRWTHLDLTSLAGPLNRPLDRTSFLLGWLGITLLELSLRVSSVLLVRGEWPSSRALAPYWLPRLFTERQAESGWLALWELALLLLASWSVALLASRRAFDAGHGPWFGLLSFVPGLGLVVCLLLAIQPSDGRAEARNRRGGHHLLHRPWVVSSFVIAAAATIALTALVAASAWTGAYGSALFLATPVLFGALVGFLVNCRRQSTFAETVLLASGFTWLGMGALLLFALEGIVCITMAIPLIWPMTVTGAVVGRVFALLAIQPSRSYGLAVLALPLFGWGQAALEPPALRQVTTAIEIDAPPAVVWDRVLNFGELPEPEGFLAETGIAIPLRARLEGEGVGAVRFCEFTTGPFVEPITVWDAPHRLAFDVTSQPHPMHEWSFYDRIEPPHLDQSFRSVRGEFLLTELPDGGTRLEGTTWYTLDIGPVAYWQLWSDWILHRIHERVLEHVKRNAEAA